MLKKAVYAARRRKAALPKPKAHDCMAYPVCDLDQSKCRRCCGHEICPSNYKCKGAK